MAVVQCMPTSAKVGFFAGTYVATDVYKIALYIQANASLNAASTTYSNTGELATAGGYTQGGQTLVGYTPGSSGDTSTGEAWVSWATNPQWTNATFTADSAVIYNVTRANAIVAILAFGSTAASSNTFTVQLPTPTAGTALMRIV